MSRAPDPSPPPERKEERKFRSLLSTLVPNSVKKVRLLLEVLTLVVLTLVACIYYGQLNTMQRAMDMTERAWVLASIVGPLLEQEGGSVVKVLLRNAGKSPAFVDFAVESSMELKPPKDQGRESGILIAGGEAENPALPHVIKLLHPAKADMADVARGARRLYVWVFIEYKDAIKGGRFTQLCWEYLAQYRSSVPCASGYQILR